MGDLRLGIGLGFGVGGLGFEAPEYPAPGYLEGQELSLSRGLCGL